MSFKDRMNADTGPEFDDSEADEDFEIPEYGEPVAKSDQPRDDNGRFASEDGGGGNYGRKDDDDTRSDARHFAREKRKASKEVKDIKAKLDIAQQTHALVVEHGKAQREALDRVHEQLKRDIETRLAASKAEIEARYAAKAAARAARRAGKLSPK